MPTSAEAKSLLILYSGLVSLNVLISFWFWYKNRTSLYSSLVRTWLGLFLALASGAVTQSNPILFALVGIIPGCHIAALSGAEILLRFINKKPNFKLLHSLAILCTISCGALYLAGLPFIVYALPAGLVVSIPLTYGLVRLLREKKEKLTTAKTGFAIACAAMVLHGLDLPVLGNRPDTIILGFTIGISIALVIAVFGPMVVLEITSAEADRLKVERGLMEKELKEAEAMLELVADTASLLPLSLDQKKIVEKTAQLGVKHFGGACAIHTLKDGKAKLQLAAFASSPTIGARSAQEFHDRYFSSVKPLDVPERVVREGRLEIVKSIEPATNIGIKSYLAVPLFDRGEVCGVLVLYSVERSLTERDTRLALELAVRVSSALQSASLFDEAERAVRLRDDFLSIASHELNTPLTPLGIQIELLRRLVEKGKLDTVPQDQLKKMLQNSDDQLKSLSKLINGLLDVSRVASGSVVLGPKENVNFAQLVREIVDRFEPQFQASGSVVEVHAEPNIIGYWDRLRIEQVVVNLITNSIKYGARKPIKIDIRGSGDKACLTVQDSGIGVAQEDRERIFERFERAVPMERFGGLGLGLYIAREIIKAHGGAIYVESEPGQYTKFITELPLKQV